MLYNYVTSIINIYLSRLGEPWNYIEDGLKRNIQDYLTVKGEGISLAKYQDLAANSLKGSKDQKFRNGFSDYSDNISQFYLYSFLDISIHIYDKIIFENLRECFAPRRSMEHLIRKDLKF